jgi:hypothetical protein
VAVAILTPLFTGVDQASFGRPETPSQALLSRDEMSDNVRIPLLIEQSRLEIVQLLVKVLDDQLMSDFASVRIGIDLQIGLC